MLISMTGYGEAERDGVRCEIRSLNNRFLRTKISVPQFLSRYDHEIESLLKERLVRGTVYCNIDADILPQTVQCDTETAAIYRDVLLDLKDSLDIKGDVSLELISRFNRIFRIETDRSQIGNIWEKTSFVLDKAIKNLISTRKKEGKQIEKDINERIKNLGEMLLEVKNRLPERMERERSKIERLSYDEPLLLLERINVEEEVTRLKFHLHSMKEILKENRSQGKKLLFLLQELLREANTIASKIQDAPISGIVVGMKTEIESLREVSENVL